MKPALLFYCQHSVGLGHLMRSYALCDRLSERFRVVLIAGGQLPEGIAAPPGVEIVALPPLGMNGENGFGSSDPRYTTERAWDIRLHRILTTLRDVRPKVVLVELFPFGRAKFAREIVPLLGAAHDAFKACSLRDILVSGDPGRDDRARRLADAHLDAILVHSDPRFARLEETFKPPTPLSVPVHYTGFVTGRDHDPPRPRGEHVVISAGGGRVGRPLLQQAIERLNGTPMRAIAGPLMPEEDFRALQRIAPRNVELLRSVPDLGQELRGARASISQCGYNTALDVVRARVPALVVPYATPEEDEQTRRAHRLEQLGLVRVSDQVDPALLDHRPAAATLDLRGAETTRDLLCELIA